MTILGGCSGTLADDTEIVPMLIGQLQSRTAKLAEGAAERDASNPDNLLYVRVWGTDRGDRPRAGFLAPGPSTTHKRASPFASKQAARSAVAEALFLWGPRVHFHIEE